MYSIRMINTYNESSLHRSLKNMLCKQYNGKTEKEVDSYICDIICDDTSIIEIQTKNLGNITGKILNLLENHLVTLVYPLPITTYVEYYKEGNLDSKPLSRRKSPVKKNLYHIFDELMGCFPVLLHKNFTLQVTEVIITKERIKTNEKMQSVNKKRRFLRDWISYDTTLDEILTTHIFKSVQDYVSLLPKNIKEKFTVKDVIDCKDANKISKQQAYKMMWTFNKMGIIEYVGKSGRSKLYKRASL